MSVAGWRPAGSSTRILPGPGAVPLVDTVSGAVTGTLSVLASGAYAFTPAPGYVGPVPTVYVTVDSTDGQWLEVALTLRVNAPVRTGDVSPSVLPNAPAIFDVLSKVATSPGVSVVVTDFTLLGGSTYSTGPNAVTATVLDPFTKATIGTVVVAQNGTVVCTPAAGFEGQVPPIAYTVTSSDGQTVPGVLGVTVERGEAESKGQGTLQWQVALLHGDAPQLLRTPLVHPAAPSPPLPSPPACWKH